MDNLDTGEMYGHVPSTSNNNIEQASVDLTDILNYIGFSQKQREHRVKVGVMQQMMDSLDSVIMGSYDGGYLRMGSSIEGTTADGMGSDIDTLVFSTSVKAYCTTKNTKPTLSMVFYRDKFTRAGYTKLQPVSHSGVIKDTSDINQGHNECWQINLEADTKGWLMVTHFPDLFVQGIIDLKHGPAAVFKEKPNQCSHDYVRSFVCEDITLEMEEWYMRDRIYDWPSKDTRDLFKTLGCFIVPVGHPSSPEKNIEWRMSFSLQERHLVWHLNPTQYHCFMLLKILKTFWIKRTFGDVLTSYHCKTLLFYTIERHDQGIWVPENLILCLRMCLILLHEWISDKYIPNYFIPNENMFVKMEAALKGNYNKLKACVAAMSDNWNVLCTFLMNFGKQFLVSIHVVKRQPITVVVDMHLKIAFSEDCSVYIDEIQNTLDYLDVILTVLQSSETSGRYNTFEENTTELYKQWFAGRTHTLDTPERFHQLTEAFQFPVQDSERYPRTFAVMVLKSGFQITLGSVLAARYFQTGNKQYLLKSDTYLELGTSLSPMYSMLIKATVLLKQSLFDTSNSILNAAEIASKDSPIICICHEHKIWHTAVGLRKEDHTWGESIFSNTEDIRTFVCMSCFNFKRCEFDILPETLTFEAYKSFGFPTDSISPQEESCADIVVVDPIMYLYYLQFLNNQHNNPGEAAVALQKLENTLFDRIGTKDTLAHADTWLNVLGDICVKKGWTRLALRCFKYSYKLRPLHNAVRWHVMFLLFSPSGCAI